MCLLALSDEGKPFYDEQVAKAVQGRNTLLCMHPALLPQLVEGALKGHDLAELAKRLGTKGI